MTELTFYWHPHHNTLCEGSYDIQERIDYIKKNKSKSEIETRLRWLTPVLHPERLPLEWKEAYQKWEEAYQKQEEAYQKRKEANQKQKEAYQKWEEAYQKWEEAYQKWEEACQKQKEAYQKRKEAYQKYNPQIESLHKEEHPDCPWDGETILHMT